MFAANVVSFVPNVVLRPLLFAANVVSKMPCLRFEAFMFAVRYTYVALSHNNLAQLYSDQERYTEAEPLYQNALAIVEQKLGAEHPNTITIRNNLEELRNNMD